MPGPLKRKRSESELPFPTSKSTTPSHLDSRTLKRHRDNRPSAEKIAENTMRLLYEGQQAQAARPPPPAQNYEPVTRPAAQQQRSSSSALPPPPQPSLYSFWKLIPRSSAASPSPTSAAQSPASALSPMATASPPPPFSEVAPPSTSCEDCGVGPSRGGGGDPDTMDVDVHDYGSGMETCAACGSCGKAVCFSCSVGNLGPERHCLMCAGRNGPVS